MGFEQLPVGSTLSGLILFAFPITPQEKVICCEVWWMRGPCNIPISGDYMIWKQRIDNTHAYSSNVGGCFVLEKWRHAAPRSNFCGVQWLLMQFSRINVSPKSKVQLVHTTGEIEVSFITHPQTVYSVLVLLIELALAHIICLLKGRNHLDFVGVKVQILMSDSSYRSVSALCHWAEWRGLLSMVTLIRLMFSVVTTVFGLPVFFFVVDAVSKVLNPLF